MLLDRYYHVIARHLEKFAYLCSLHGPYQGCTRKHLLRIRVSEWKKTELWFNASCMLLAQGHWCCFSKYPAFFPLSSKKKHCAAEDFLMSPLFVFQRSRWLRTRCLTRARHVRARSPTPHQSLIPHNSIDDSLREIAFSRKADFKRITLEIWSPRSHLLDSDWTKDKPDS